MILILHILLTLRPGAWEREPARLGARSRGAHGAGRHTTHTRTPPPRSPHPGACIARAVHPSPVRLQGVTLPRGTHQAFQSGVGIARARLTALACLHASSFCGEEKGLPKAQGLALHKFFSCWQRPRIIEEDVSEKWWEGMPKVTPRKPPALWDRSPELGETHKAASTFGCSQPRDQQDHSARRGGSHSPRDAEESEA